MQKITFTSLPTELHFQILSYLDVDPPSYSRFTNRPTPHMLESESERPLKNASEVNKKWRSVALPLLFRHTIWRLQPYRLIQLSDCTNPRDIRLIKFLIDHNICDRIDSMVLLVEPPLDDDDEVDIQPPPEALLANCEILWDTLFSVIDPLRFTIISRPARFGLLLAIPLDFREYWSYGSHEHILSFSRDSRFVTPPPQLPASDSVLSIRSKLFTIRPWTATLLNEGCNLGVYRTYDHHRKHPPSILSALLSGPHTAGLHTFLADRPLLAPSVQDFSYIAEFPIADHFLKLVQHLPLLRRLYVQLVPKPHILKDDYEMRNIDPRDLWMERNASYAALMTSLFTWTPSTNWRSLRVFESGDTADKQAWDMAAHFVLHAQTKKWAIEREGVFVWEEPDGKKAQK
ncbi:hypothetical protein jhhlp_006334 [Lomentospora prolificans]|uniref:Uncharacterized protein n=1 Tax=Lomentospora prolificans TaxID=41688 RepID=A0A2N3N5M1_9PEZI|nr:hypothetical protein jhhlp_006334 [Lomentospora prolificans]